MEFKEIKEKVIEKYHYCRNAVKQKKDDVVFWYHDNEEFVKAVAPFAILGGLGVAKNALKRSKQKRDEDLHDNYIYDNRHGNYYKLKSASSRKRNKQYMEINRRRDQGENLYDILDDMKLLK